MDWYVEEPQELPALRAEVRAFLARHAAVGADVQAAELVVSELVTNGLRHTGRPVWVSIEWSGEQPVLSVRDLGDGFELEPSLPENRASPGGGRGLYIVSRMTERLEARHRAAGGTVVQATLALRRRPARSFDPPRRHLDALPALDEALPTGAFGREAFLRALVVQLAQALEHDHGPEAAEASVTQVGTDIGGQMEAEYRAAFDVVGPLSPAQLGACFVRLKHAIDGGFRVVDADERRVVLVNSRCPFGDDAVRRAPTLCRMTSSVFGGIAARNVSNGRATVSLDERIAVGDPECRVVVWLAPEDAPGGHQYRAAGAGDSPA